ncbi:MAG TPA: 50S ribosomal protein L13 [Nitrososphaeraceae archaeon]|nr:50S ribosomal protein L13 [Nitrososphaeraceae archaeon]
MGRNQQSQQHQQGQSTNLQGGHRNEVIVDATDCIAGRMCSRVSKLLLKGNRVSIVNSENAMLSGDKYKTIDLYKEFLEINSVTNPVHGPFHPRRPDTILTKMVRGMIPKTKTSGVEAFKRLRVYIGTPHGLSKSKTESFEDTKITRSPSRYISVGEVAKQIGWKGVLRNESEQRTQDQNQQQQNAKKETGNKADRKAMNSKAPPQEVNIEKDKKGQKNE